MKKIIIITMLLLYLCTLSGCKESIESTSKLTLEKVIELSKKGAALTWSDFDQYDHVDTGSGLMIWSYDINNDYKLQIGGIDLGLDPMYIYLVSTEDESDYIDIREENVEEFINNR